MNREELKKLSVEELKKKCKELGLSGYSRKKEDELIDMILKATKDKEDNKEDEVKEEEDKVVFIKLIDAVFSFQGKDFKEKEFVLTKEEAEHMRIKHAIKLNLIKVKETKWV